MTTPAPLLQLVTAGFRYNDRQILANINLSLPEGSCAALIGPNGAGKTTLLRLASGAFPKNASRTAALASNTAALSCRPLCRARSMPWRDLLLACCK